MKCSVKRLSDPSSQHEGQEQNDARTFDRVIDSFTRFSEEVALTRSQNEKR